MENEQINEAVKPTKPVKPVKDEYDSIYSRIMNWITLRTGIRPNTYSIFVWMRQVNSRVLRLENKQVEQAVAERAESEAFIESLKDKLEARIDILEQRTGELEGRIIELGEKDYNSICTVEIK